MKCCRCKEEMIVMELHNIEADYCVDCGGIWLDEGELELLLHGEISYDDLAGKFEREHEIEESTLECPHCGELMEKLLFEAEEKDGKRTITIDQCLKHHGLWFDKGELRDVVNYLVLDEENRIIKLLNDMFSLKD
ncbi:MAG: zf-TFIIB domain-containing protein [Halanaerobiaceae bacterium]|nr:zf-TFIIB domain-containing protein [Halanaerobiaceae bacterium]